MAEPAHLTNNQKKTFAAVFGPLISMFGNI